MCQDGQSQLRQRHAQFAQRIEHRPDERPLTKRLLIELQLAGPSLHF
jgi:hypothetical protein